MSITFLSIQGSYKSLEIALFANSKYVDLVKEDNKKASSTLIPHIQTLLTKHSLTLKDLNFIALDQGPGAFTSLRVAITTANAISFATGIPLIGIDGIDALATEAFKQNVTGNITVLLNAYHQDVYFGIFKSQNNILELVGDKGYENIDNLLTRLELPTTVVGNAATIYKYKLSDIKIVDIPEAPATRIGLMALDKWNKQESISSKLMPLYLKTQRFKPKY